MRIFLLTLGLWLVGGCRSAPPLDEVLFAVDAEALSARAAADAMPNDAGAQANAARWLGRTADVRLMEDQIARASEPGLSVLQVVQFDETASGELKNTILGLCSAGLEYGSAAADLAPDDPLALYYRALNLSLVAWAEGKAVALLRGRGPKLKAVLKSVAERFPDFLGAAPLRLRARFLDRAPWPYGDRKEAIELLREATRLAPTPVNWQFLGDALWVDGQKESAVTAWRSGSTADADLSIEPGADLRRRLNQARVDVYEGAQSVRIP